MDDIPNHDNLEEILVGLQAEETTVRERAIDRLHSYTCRVAAPRNDALTQAEAIEEWGRKHRQCFQERSIVEALLAAIDDPSVRVRRYAALMLGHPTAPEAQASLLRHLREDPVENVRTICAMSLDSSPNTPQKVQGFMDALRDANHRVVSPACKSLGKLGDPRAVEPLRAVLSHPCWNVRFKACEALVRLQAADLRLVSLLEELNQQAEADIYNESVHKRNELSAEFMPTAARAQTTEEVLDQARRALL